jgi:uncharacterized hydrophobic protein (TIGR00271 family)
MPGDADEPRESAQSPLGQGLGVFRGPQPSRPTAEEQDAVDELMPMDDGFAGFARRFCVLTMLSAAIAGFGLVADSSAVVIGAMLVAPLMTPITVMAASTVTADNRRLARASLLLLVGAALAIAVGWLCGLLTAFDINSPSELTPELLGRTNPRLIDLAIAIAAGAAAGYIAPRRSAVGALPGVGIAVALVPPLATVGITAELGFTHEAWRALLLFLTNLVAIIFAAALMLIAAGFRPRQGTSRGSLRVRVAVTLVGVVLVAIPLSLHTRSRVHELTLRHDVVDSIATWDPTVDVTSLTTELVGGTAEVKLAITSAGVPSPPQQLAEEISRRSGYPVTLRLSTDHQEVFEATNG